MSRLLDLGKKWRTDAMDIYDGYNREFKPDLQKVLQCKLNHSLWGKPGEEWDDAVLISFWWD